MAAKQPKVFRVDIQPTNAMMPTFVSEPDEDSIKSHFSERFQYHGTKTDLEAGVPVCEKLVQESGSKILPQILYNSPWVCVSEPVRALIEELEPSVHAFTDEVKVFHKNGAPSEHRYFGLAWGPDLNGTIIVEKSKEIVQQRLIDRGNAVPFSSGAPEGRLAIDQDLVTGRHLWRAPDYYLSWFGSGELIAGLKKIKVRGLNYYEQVLVQR